MPSPHVDDRPRRRTKLLSAAVCFLGLLVIGWVDYLIGYRISLLSFYAIPIGVAVFYVGPVTALVLSLAAVAISRGGDLLSGMPYPGNFIFFSNCAIPFAFFTFFVAVLAVLNEVRKRLESTVEQRNRALLQEMHERGRLEREVIELSEREHRRFGQELHQLVSQELAAIALDNHLLARNLLASGHAEAGTAHEVALKIDRALTKARNIACGYFTLGFDAPGLAEALGEIAQRTQKNCGITCTVHCPENLDLANEDATVQVFRIVQEAMQNAARHSAATQVSIRLERIQDHFLLAIQDNGKGLPAAAIRRKPGQQGLGLSIMAYRTSLLGGKFAIEHPHNGGTRIVCEIPALKLTRRAPALAL